MDTLVGRTPLGRVTARRRRRAGAARWPPPVAVAAAVAALALLVGSASALDSEPWFDGWFETPFAAEIVTTGPALDAPEHSLLRVGDRAIRLEGAQDDVPFVVLYRFEPDRVELHMLDPVSNSVIAVAFDPNAEPVELDLLAIGSLLVPPSAPHHPCRTHPGQAACALDGDDRIDGTDTERWRVRLDDGFGLVEAFVLWVGHDGLVRRLRYTDGTQIDLRGYDLGPQPADAFDVPDAYDRR